MVVEPWVWVGFAALVVGLLLVDLALFAGRGKEISLGRAAAWSVGWTVLGVAFGGVLWIWQDERLAGEYLAGFVIEKSLSVDNLFVFALIFAYFRVPPAYQRRAIFWGIVAAIVLRALFILAGAAVLEAFHYAVYVFGAFLVFTGVRMAFHRSGEVHPERNPVLRLLGRVIPLTGEYHGDDLTVRKDGKRLATPMLAALASIATFDVVFAVDSIPAIFAITRETFLVYSANAFSLLGLSALYFLLAGMMGRFRYLNVGLAAVLVFVGAKMALADVYEIPVSVSLAVIVGTLAAAVAASWLRRGEPPTEQGADVNEIVITSDGVLRLNEELDRLRTDGRRSIAERLRAVTASEANPMAASEYREARADQERLEARIARLEEQLRTADVVEPVLGNGCVDVGERVRVRDLDSGIRFELELVGPLEADADLGRVSVASPLGRAIVGRRRGEVVEVDAPRGTRRVKVLAVEPATPA
jgi:tellurite resistance protein TerC